MKKSEFKKVVTNYIKEEEERIKEHEEVINILKPLEGKQFNFKTFNKKNLKGFKFVSENGMFYIKGKYSHLIGYGKTPGVNVEQFKDWDACNGKAAAERIEKIRSVDIERAFKIFNQIDKRFNELRNLFGDIEIEKLDSFNFPPYYDILRLIKEDKETSSDEIRMSDFYYIRK